MRELFPLLTLSFCSTLALVAQTSASPSDTAPVDPDKAALIRQLVAGPESEQLRKRILTIVVPDILKLTRQNPTYPPGYAEEREKKLTERTSSIDFVELMTPVYAQHFSVDELKQIVASRNSAAGRKLTDLEPEISSETLRRGSATTRTLAQQVDKEIFSEHPDWAQQVHDNQRKMDASSDAAPGSQPYRIGGDVIAPVLIQKIEPQYTEDARHAKLSGTVLLFVIIDENGVPRNIRVLRPLGMGLDEKAIEAVTQWRFRPGNKAGVPVATQAQIQVNFRLLDKPPQ